MEKVEAMVKKAKVIAQVIKDYPREIRLISHYDCDGICSAAIMTKALTREGKYFRLSFVKQLLEDSIQELAKEGYGIFIFTDLGSGQLELLQKTLIKDSKIIIVADHHQVQGEILSKNVFHINPSDFGIENNIAGSGVTYLLARAMDTINRDLSEFAVIGAIGDSQINSIGPDWGLFGLNKEILKDAQRTNKIKITKGLRIWGKTKRPIHKALEYSFDPFIPGVSGSESGAVRFLHDANIPLKNKNIWRTISDLSEEEVKRLASHIIKERVCNNVENPDWIFGDVYELQDKKEFSDANEFATLLNATGKQDIGYQGVALCLNCKDALGKANKILDSYRREIGKGLSWFYSNENALKKMEFSNYLLAGSNISEHVISNVVSVISKSDCITGPDKPVFAFVDTSDGKVKISARMSDNLVEKGLSLQEIMNQAVKKFKGEGGGHQGAAGGLIPKGEEGNFIKEVEKIIANKFKKEFEEKKPKTEKKEIILNSIEKEVEEKPKRKTGWEKFIKNSEGE